MAITSPAVGDDALTTMQSVITRVNDIDTHLAIPDSGYPINSIAITDSNGNISWLNSSTLKSVGFNSSGIPEVQTALTIPSLDLKTGVKQLSTPVPYVKELTNTYWTVPTNKAYVFTSILSGAAGSVATMQITEGSDTVGVAINIDKDTSFYLPVKAGVKLRHNTSGGRLLLTGFEYDPDEVICEVLSTSVTGATKLGQTDYTFSSTGGDWIITFAEVDSAPANTTHYFGRLVGSNLYGILAENTNNLRELRYNMNLYVPASTVIRAQMGSNASHSGTSTCKSFFAAIKA